MRSSGGMFHIEPQLTTRKRRIQTLVSHQLSYSFHHEQKQMSYKLLSINSHTNSCLSTLLYLFHDGQTESKQLSYKLLSLNSPKCIFIITSKVSRNNSHTNSCHSTLIQTLVTQFSHKLLSIKSHTNFFLSIVIQTLVVQLSSLFHHEQR